jgi:membrane-associated protein
VDPSSLVDFILHINLYLGRIVQVAGGWVYFVLFLIVFCETGLVVMPFLPGDSLLFAAGALSAAKDPLTGGTILNIWGVMAALGLGAFIGDSTNYLIGRFLGPRVMKNEDSRVFRKSYLDETQRYFDKYGARTVVIARFVPIVRTFAPFMAGVGRMDYLRFVSFSLAGTILWVASFVLAGYFFGNIPAVQENFTLAVLGILALSLVPWVAGFIRHRGCLRPVMERGSRQDGPRLSETGTSSDASMQESTRVPVLLCLPAIGGTRGARRHDTCRIGR